MADERQEIERIRAALEEADTKLAEALDDRARAVTALAALKASSPEAYFSLPRDHEVVARTIERIKVFPKDAVRPVLTEVLSACAQMTAPLVVAYVGQDGGFGHTAARKHFGSSAAVRGVETAEEALSEVERGRASYAIVPFETSNDGAVTATLNLLARSDLKISAEIRIQRAFRLISLSGARDRVAKVYAASSALAACEAYLSQNFPQATIIDARNGIAAAQHAKDEEDAAAIVTELVAQQSGLALVDDAIADLADLETRYVAVGSDFPPRTGRDRTAVVIALHDAPGVLIDCLRPLADRKLNIYRLETRPARGWAWRYLILVEVDGHLTDRPILAALEELRTSSRYVKVLGSHPITEP